MLTEITDEGLTEVKRISSKEKKKKRQSDEFMKREVATRVLLAVCCGNSCMQPFSLIYRIHDL